MKYILALMFFSSCGRLIPRGESFNTTGLEKKRYHIKTLNLFRYPFTVDICEPAIYGCSELFTIDRDTYYLGRGNYFLRVLPDSFNLLHRFETYHERIFDTVIFKNNICLSKRAIYNRDDQSGLYSMHLLTDYYFEEVMGSSVTRGRIGPNDLKKHDFQAKDIFEVYKSLPFFKTIINTETFTVPDANMYMREYFYNH